MKFVINGLIVITIFSFTSACPAQYNQQRGTVLGGLTGAAAGAIIGDNSGEAGVGAAIGGVVGAIAGSALGNAEDQRNRYYYAAQQQQLHNQRNYQLARGVSLQDVVAMTRSGVSEGVIMTTIQNKGVTQSLEVNDIVYLSQSGVSDGVIRTMQQAAGGVPVVARQVVVPPVIATRPAPTVVIRGYGGGPRYYGYGPRYPAPCHHHSRGGYYR